MSSASRTSLAERRGPPPRPSSSPPAPIAARPASSGLRSPTSSGSAGTSASVLGDRGQGQHRQRVRPRLRLQLDCVEPDRHDQVGLHDQLALDQPADDAAGAQRMILRDHALALGGGQHRRAQLLGERDELGRWRRTRARRGRPSGSAAWPRQHVERRLEVGAVRSGRRSNSAAAAARPRSRRPRASSRSAGTRNAPGPAASPIAVRMARRTCWRTVLASIVAFHFTIGS